MCKNLFSHFGYWFGNGKGNQFFFFFSFNFDLSKIATCEQTICKLFEEIRIRGRPENCDDVGSYTEFKRDLQIFELRNEIKLMQELRQRNAGRPFIRGPLLQKYK